MPDPPAKNPFHNYNSFLIFNASNSISSSSSKISINGSLNDLVVIIRSKDKSKKATIDWLSSQTKELPKQVILKQQFHQNQAIKIENQRRGQLSVKHTYSGFF